MENSEPQFADHAQKAADIRVSNPRDDLEDFDADLPYDHETTTQLLDRLKRQAEAVD